MKKRGPIFRILYWLFGAVLSFGIIWLIAGSRIADLLTSKGVALYKKGEIASAKKYLQAAKIFRPGSVINNNYLKKVQGGQDTAPSIEEVRRLLRSKNDGIIIEGLDMAKEWKMISLRSEVELLAEKGSEEVSNVADEVLMLFKNLATPMRCSACNARYTSKLPDESMPYLCMNCRSRALYPEDRFTIKKLYCNSCGGITIREDIPGRGYSNICSKCGNAGIMQMYACRSCGHTWGGGGFVMSCPKCRAKEVGSVSVTAEEAAQFRNR